MAASLYPGSALEQVENQFRFAAGGVSIEVLAGTYTFSKRTPNVASFDPDGSNRNVQLEAEEACKGFFGIYHNGGNNTNNLVFLNDAGGTVVTLGDGEWCVLSCDGSAWTAFSSSAFGDLLASANTWTAANEFQGATTLRNVLLGAATELTIAAGAVAATRSFHTIDTEADAGSDDLDDITGGAAGEMLLIRPADAARAVVLRHAVGANKIATLGARNISLAEVTDWALLVSDGTQWAVLAASTLADGILAATNTWTGAATFTGGITTTGERNASAGATAITTTRVMTLADAGGIFTVAQSSAYDIDLPSPTSGAGCRYLFQLVSPGAFNVTITVAGAAATFEGTISNDVDAVLVATGSTLTFASGASALGDWIEAISTSTSKYFIRAVTSATGGITVA